MTLTNNGPDNAPSGIRVTDSLQPGLVYSASVPSQGIYDNVTGRWDVGALAVSGSATLSITAQTAPGSAGSTIPNTATITTFTIPDTGSGNNSATVNITVGPPLNADLRITKSVDNASPYPGDPVTYTVILTNDGPGPATGIGVLDLIPPGLTLVNSTPSQGGYAGGVWTVGALSASSSATLTLLTQVDPGTEGNLITNTALISAADQFDPDGSDNIASVDLTVQTPPSPPVANDDSASTPVNVPVIIDVLANDTDANGNIDPASVTIVNPPTSGTITNIDAGTGAVTFQSGTVGPDTFTYQVCDTTLLCASATVSITVTP